VRTELARAKDRERVYELVRQECASGGQAFVVVPLVDPSEKLDLKSAQAEAERLAAEVFPDLRVDFVHGRMTAERKDALMGAFQRGEIQVLVATVVVEVGVDVPTASVMVVEHAERFGLGQLHQLRGRIGRGERPSTCVLMAGEGTRTAMRRLKVMVETQDGFRIAEEDFRIRGPGEFFGTRQHGAWEFRSADLRRDVDLLARARKEAFAEVARRGTAVLDASASPECAGRRWWLARMFGRRLDLADVG